MIDVIGIYDKNFQQLFLNTKFMKCQVLDTSSLFSHPLEDGSQMIDHKIKNPLEIQLTIILAGDEYKNIYKSLKKVDDNAELLTIQTKTDVYKNMLIQALPYEEDAEVYNGIKLTLSLKQAQFETAKTRTTINPKYSKDSTKTRVGNVQGETLSNENPKRQSVLKSIL